MRFACIYQCSGYFVFLVEQSSVLVHVEGSWANTWTYVGLAPHGLKGI